jgi:H+-translocating NAD(P) transhydrogenase subunit alpha
MTIIAVTAENQIEPRVAISPDTVKKYKALGCTVRVETGAGKRSRFSDAMLAAAGAEIMPTAAATLEGADILLKVRRPSAEEAKALKPGALLAAMISPHDDRANLEALVASGVNVFSMEFMPRITRAQSMDVLSSQANLAGYKAVIDAAAMFEQAMPMMMTAAGTVPAARVFVMGAGVAGLQAIATARRLGAVVTATDVRPAAKEQVASLGAKFIAVEDDEFKQAQTAAGYAKPMSAGYQAKQAELITTHLKTQDIVITTALIPGRPAPRLITAAMVDGMKAGAVIVDLAAERGGNCELTKPDAVTDHNGVSIAGPTNLAGEIAVNASNLYAKNLFAFLDTMFDKKTKAFGINWDDEIIKGTLVGKDGKIVHTALNPQPLPPVTAVSAAPSAASVEKGV